MTENKGLFAMFGGAAPTLTPKLTFKKAEDIKTKEELAREAAIAAAKAAKAGPAVNNNGGGGAWKTATTKRTSRGLALKARAMGKSVTVSESKTIVPDHDEDDVSMGGMGNKKKKRL
jgi:hypothetical protein